MVATVGGSAVSNSIGVPVGYADLGIVAQQKIIGGKNYILYTVTNTGNLSAEASLVIRKYAQNGQTLASAEGLAVPAGETTVYTFDASAVAENELVYAAVTTAEYEPFVLNNEALINLLHIDTDVYLYTPQDTVENPQLSVTTVTYDKYTDDAVSVNILVGKDKLSAITGLTKGVDYTVNNGAVAISRDYLQTLGNGTHTLVFHFDYQKEELITRNLVVTVSDSTPIPMTGDVSIIGDGTVGSVLTADNSRLQPQNAVYYYAWSIDGVTVGSENSYTVKKADYGKKITLTVTAKNGYTGSFSATIVADYKTQPAPAAPIAAMITENSVQLIVLEGLEYSMDQQAWSSDGLFQGLNPNTCYNFYARAKATENAYASPQSAAAQITTAKSTQNKPDAPQMLENTCESITLVAAQNMEYRIQGGKWTDNNVFTGLQPNTSYIFYQRYKQTDEAFASEASSASIATSDRTPIAGTVTIEGSPILGSTLVVTIENFTGELQSVEYQWYRDDEAIEGASTSTYTIKGTDIGTVLKVCVTGTGAYRGELSAQLYVKNGIAGDVNGDGKVNFADYSKVLAHAKNPSSNILMGDALRYADINGDGIINFSDCSKVLALAKGGHVLE